MNFSNPLRNDLSLCHNNWATKLSIFWELFQTRVLEIVSNPKICFLPPMASNWEENEWIKLPLILKTIYSKYFIFWKGLKEVCIPPCIKHLGLNMALKLEL